MKITSTPAKAQLVGGRRVTPADLAGILNPERPLDLATIERGIIGLALKRAGNILGAAQELGISRHALKRRMDKYGFTLPLPDQGVLGA